jgi:hypothetical protein
MESNFLVCGSKRYCMTWLWTRPWSEVKVLNAYVLTRLQTEDCPKYSQYKKWHY